MDFAKDCARSQIKRADIKKAYLSEKEVAERLNMSVKWLQKMRCVGGGIKYSKFGNAVRYPIEEIEAYEKISQRLHTSEGLDPNSHIKAENSNSICSMQPYTDYIYNQAILLTNQLNKNK